MSNIEHVRVVHVLGQLDSVDILTKLLENRVRSKLTTSELVVITSWIAIPAQIDPHQFSNVEIHLGNASYPREPCISRMLPSSSDVLAHEFLTGCEHVWPHPLSSCSGLRSVTSCEGLGKYIYTSHRKEQIRWNG
jgi:hypothetical protein